MIRSLFLRLEPYKGYFFLGFMVCNTLAATVSQLGLVPEIVPGVPIPDVATLHGGRLLSPSQVLAWYSMLEMDKTAKSVYFMITVLDLVGIIPCYTIWLGCEIAPLHIWHGILCHVPIWTALFDILETGTHFWAIQDRYLQCGLYRATAYWKPPSSILAAACIATPFKFAGILLSLLLVGYTRCMARPSKRKTD